jgi:hypothetical protein
MDIPKEQEREATSEKEELQAIDSPEKKQDKASADTESSLSEKRDMALAPYTQKPEGEVPAGKSTGPKTLRGKENSKHNALKHGIFSQVALMKEDPRAEFDSLLSGLRNYFEPEGTLEELLVDKLAVNVWRLRRLVIAEKKQATKKSEYSALVDDDAPRLELLLRYESSLERTFDRTLNHLDRLKRIREGQAVPPALNVNVST